MRLITFTRTAAPASEPSSTARSATSAPRRRCPPTYLGIGLNCADHVAESGLPKPAFPTFFNKQTACVTGPYDPIHLPRVSRALDYEGELAVVIGRRARRVPAEGARGHRRLPQG